MSTILEVILKTAGFTEGATAIKKVGDEATNTNNKLKTTTSTVDQVSKSTTSLGSKLANAGKQFSGTITNVAALGSTVVNLSRQYQDLSDTQIRVDKTQLKVSRTAEAVRAAQAKLNTLVSQGVKSGAKYEQALLDVQQAQEASTLAVTMNGEALEDQQRAYENFFMGLAPTILTAGSSITSMFKEMGGDKGIGGLTTKLKGLPSSLGMSTKAFAGMAGAIGLASLAMVELIKQLKIGAEIKELQIINEGPSRTSATIQAEIAKLKEQKASIRQQLKDFFFQGPLGQQITGMKSGAFVIDEVVKSLESKESRDKLIAGLQKTLAAVMNTPMDPSVKASVVTQIKTIMAMYGNDANWSAGYGATAEAVSKNTQKVIKDGFQKAIDAIAASPDVGAGLTGALRTLYDKTLNYPGTTFTGQTAKAAANPILVNIIPTNDALNKAYAKFKSDSDAALRAQFDKEPALDEDWFLGSFAQTSEEFQKGFDDMAKASADAAQKIKDDQKAAAAETLAAWDKTFNSQVSALDKIFAAYHKLHPGGTIETKKGTKTYAPGQLPVDIAQKAFEQFESGLAQKITSPASAKAYAQNWMTTAAGHMKGVAGQLLTPITLYIQEHSKDAPEAFLLGLKEVIGGYDATKTFQQLLQPGVPVAFAVAQQTTDALGEIKVPPASLASVNGLSTAIQTIPPKTVPSITAKVIGKTAVDALNNAIAHVKSKTVTVAVKAQLDKQLAPALAYATRNVQKSQGKQHGYQSTVHRPTMFMAGEGGRPEDVTVRPRGSVQRGGSGGGGSTHITISFEPQEFAQFIRYRINDNQGVVK